MADNFGAYRKAILGGLSEQTPTSPLGDFPELAALSRSSFQLPGASAAAGAAGNVAQIGEANRRQAESIARRKKIDEITQKIQDIKDSTDPNKYQKAPKADGGFDFFDPKGNPISVAEYAKVTGKPVASILKDSQNFKDIQFIQDFDELQELVDATANGLTPEEKEKIEKKHPGIVGKIKNLTPDELIKQFRSYYPNVYNPAATSSQVTDTTRPAGEEIYSGQGGGFFEGARDILNKFPIVGSFIKD